MIIFVIILVLVSVVCMNLIVWFFVLKSVFIKEEEYKDKYEIFIDYKLLYVKRECMCSFGKDLSFVDGIGLD